VNDGVPSILRIHDLGAGFGLPEAYLVAINRGSFQVQAGDIVALCAISPYKT
jgi:hypothetical protein